MGKTRKIEPRTKRFAELHKELSDQKKMITHAELAKVLGFNTKRSITEILKRRQNIDQDQWERFKIRFDIKEQDPGPENEVQKNPISPENKKSIDYKEKYFKQLEKENKIKDRTIEKLSLAVDNIKVVDDKIERIKSTVYDLQGKFSNYEPMILGLREFVTEEIAGLKKISRESATAALGNKEEAHRKKA